MGLGGSVTRPRTHKTHWARLMGLSLVLAVGCAPKRVPKSDAVRVVEEVRERSMPRALQARFQIKVGTGMTAGSTTGAIVTHMPNRFRLEILTPLGTPMYTVASNGTAIHAWSQQKATFYQGTDAMRVLTELTGGVVGMADVLQLLTGGLPLSDAPMLASEVQDDGVLVVLEAPENIRVRALIDPRRSWVRRVEIGRTTDDAPTELKEVLAVFNVTDHMHSPGGWYPEEMLIELPPVGWTLALSFHTWDELGVIPDVFDIQAPPGAKVEDLEASLRAAASRRAGDAAGQVALPEPSGSSGAGVAPAGD